MPRDVLASMKERAPVELASYALTAVMFVLLFAKPATLMFDAWWNDPNSGHGLLLAPLSLYFAWKSGIVEGSKPQRVLGAAILIFAVLFRYAADLAAELFVMRGSMLMALAGLTVWYAGFRQLLHWWLPFTLTALSIPIPEVILNTVALPLQFMASKIGAGLLKWRDIPVMMNGNVIRIPGQELFVAEACSGLRSLTALLSLGVLLGAMFLQKWPTRLLLILVAIPIAIAINGFRIFLTGFLVLFVSPEMGEGFMHTSEGMMMFGAAFVITAGVAWLLGSVEAKVLRRYQSTV
ncbi:exosortase/archaeosortase family protein [Gemmatimonas sp.]|uniref:exosortase/archaeosortase family protein n=1 Tax=Gemmatimonas sp. TaxID=1962908 RepID=UPI00286D7CC2|nr:exosortase/archaeosortase family protein [Gemmatimonas sp.]